MKKLVISAALVLLATAASATEFGASLAKDYAADQTGVRVTAAFANVSGITPVASVTFVDNIYTRFAMGGEYKVATVGPVAFNVAAAGVYQDSRQGANGYGLTFGAKASMAVAKNVKLVAGVERFVGQSRVSGLNGNTVTVGATYSF